MIRLFTILLATSLTLAVTIDVQAQCGQCDDGCTACAAPAASCCSAPACQAAGSCCGGPRCVGKAELVDVEKHCWKIECEEICVPAVRFPWQHGGNKLTLFSLFQKKGRCGKSSCCDSSCDGGCASAGCTSSGCDGCSAGCNACVAPKCGFVKTIRDLKKETYKEKACEYSIAPPESTGSACDCAAPGGCAACASQPMEVMTPAVAGYQYAPQQPYVNDSQFIPHPAATQHPTMTQQPTLTQHPTSTQYPTSTQQPIQVAPNNLFDTSPQQVPKRVPTKPIPIQQQTVPVMNEIPAPPQAPNMPSVQVEVEKTFRLVSRGQTKSAPKRKTKMINFFKPKSK